MYRLRKAWSRVFDLPTAVAYLRKNEEQQRYWQVYDGGGGNQTTYPVDEPLILDTESVEPGTKIEVY